MATMTTITGIELKNGLPVVGGVIQARPVVNGQLVAGGVFELQSGTSWAEIFPPWPSTTTASDGSWSLPLPQPASLLPTGLQWAITLTDGLTTYAGVVPTTSPLTLYQLVQSPYNWAAAQLPGGPTVLPMQGPTGPAGATGPAGPNIDATTTTIGSLLLRTAPASGHPIALTVPDLGTASGPASLDASSHVLVAQLPVATATVVGAVKPGTNLTVAADGTLSSATTGPVPTCTANASIAVTDTGAIANAANLTMTLPSATTAQVGRAYLVKNGASGTATTVASAGGTIDGATTYTGLTAAYQSAFAISDGTNWFLA